jgi:hypothetical protein
MEEVAESINLLSTSLSGLDFSIDFDLIFGLFIVLGMFTIALWRKDKEPNVESSIMFLIVCGLVTIYIALTWIDDYQGVALAMSALGGYQLFEAVRLGIVAGGPSKGMSQFKGWYGKIRGWF